MTGGPALSDIAHAAGEFLEVARFGKVAIDGGEADVGDAIELAQAVHDHRADPIRGDLVTQRFDLALDA